MLEKILITSFCVFAIWYTMQPREIFGFIEKWWKQKEDALLDRGDKRLQTAKAIDDDIDATGADMGVSIKSAMLKKEADRFFERQQLLEKISQPLFRCPVCMVPGWGSGVYWLVWGMWQKTACWQEWLLTVICTIGFNAIVINLWPPSK
jgi:hypothetical protein